MLPALAVRTGARAVIAPIDHAAWVPLGLRGQLLRELRAMGVEIVFPEPFCALTEDGLGPVAAEFARHFGRPRLRVAVDPFSRILSEIAVERCSPCGSTHFAAEKARGMPAAEAVPRPQALVELASNSFNYHVHGVRGFEALVETVERCSMWRLEYGDLDEATAWFDALGVTP